MENITPDIRQLIIDDLKGTIAPQDKERLDKMRQESTYVSQLYDRMCNTLAQPEFAQKLDTITSYEGLTALELRIDRRKSFWSAIYTAGGAIVAFAIVFLCVHAFFNNHTSRSERMGEHIVLVLDNGMTLGLEGDSISDKALVRELGLILMDQTLYIAERDGNGQRHATISVPQGKSFKLVLADHSTIMLNAQSSIRFPLQFEEHQRMVAIEGEAYLDITEVANAPFLIKAGNQTIEVLGTDFNVNCYDSSAITTTLISGKVRISNGSDTVMMSPGQAVSAGSVGRFKVSRVDTAAVICWKNGKYIIYDQSVQQLADLIPRWFGYQVKVEPSAIDKGPISAVIFRHRPLLESLHHLKSIGIIDYAIDRDSVIVLK